MRPKPPLNQAAFCLKAFDDGQMISFLTRMTGRTAQDSMNDILPSVLSTPCLAVLAAILGCPAVIRLGILADHPAVMGAILFPCQGQRRASPGQIRLLRLAE